MTFSLSPQHIAWIKEYESLPDPELALLSEFSGEGRDSPDRAALARYVLNKGSSLIRDGREERTLKIAEEANSIARSEAAAALRSARYAMYAAIIATVSAVYSAKDFILALIFGHS